MAGPKLTPARPCTFDDACTPDDAAAWVYLAEHWTDAADDAAQSPEQHATVARLRTFVEQLAEGADGCTALDCQTFVRELVGATERARMLVVAWSGEGPEIPGPWWLSALPKLFPSTSAGMWKLLPWLMLGALAIEAGKRSASRR